MILIPFKYMFKYHKNEWYAEKTIFIVIMIYIYIATKVLIKKNWYQISHIMTGKCDIANPTNPQ